MNTAKITQRQSEVLDGIAARKTLKEIAASMAISESRVKDHVRALKQTYDANSLSQLAAIRQGHAKTDPCPKRTPPKSRLPESLLILEEAPEVEPSEDLLTFRDASPNWVALPPWHQDTFARLALGEPDGRHAVWVRLRAIAVMAGAFFAAVVLALAAYKGLVELYS